MGALFNKKCDIQRKTPGVVVANRNFNRPTVVPTNNLVIVGSDVPCGLSDVKEMARTGPNEYVQIITKTLFVKDLLLPKDIISNITNKYGDIIDPGPYTIREITPIGFNKIHHYEAKLEKAE